MHGPLPGSEPDPRRQAILRHARRRFTADGFASTKMEAVAREAGVSTATLYAQFAGKSDLFSAVIDDAAEEFTAQMMSVFSEPRPARDQLTDFAVRYARFMADPFVRSVFRLVMAERPRFREVAVKFFEKGKSEFGAYVIDVIRQMRDRGELRVDRPSWAAGQLFGMIEHPVFFMPLVTGDEVMPVRAADQIAADAVETFMARYGVVRR
ncbi:MAG: TetR/AcrR family transcriptional regulator [Alphaproteobacteria bacterium]|nr:TetR/AcrR family transcriptional regulator [Alphaproteobacteria bacterium]MBU1525542.1 TetR/AcrR family transcriptional regulator [Alphaproteobacteria bacterium]MBU2117815.1 TetR/AcrR family transcriptional regulator [Alphaproteobacteria bacterium]MBU2350477.1 TetR/AcrR family transcriptional regulator [Alphaproteobacteria bacterium]MBU2381530.1 TetR/AcrR family transcriptional regulator [Alphaproteobacteria bacterium]